MRDEGRSTGAHPGAGGRPVVVGLGPDAADGDALVWAAAEAAVRQVPLHVVHVVPHRFVVDPCGALLPVDGLPGVTAEAAGTLETALARVRSVTSGTPVSGCVLAGAPAPLLLQESRAAGLLVLGGRAPHPGRLPSRLAARAGCPVVVVRDRPRVPARPCRPSVVVGVEGAGSSAAALGFAFAAAAQRGVPLTAVHAWGADVPADLEGVCGAPAVAEQEAREVLARVLGPLCRLFPDVEVRSRAVRADPAVAVTAASSGAALVVVGCRRLGPLRRRLARSVSSEVVRCAPAPVAVVGADRAGSRVPPGPDAHRQVLRRTRARPGG
ncbi:Nucleotide-binding universal stress protein, UspA family [Geodermatophilus telluris]|uniref:Nucleotide-binding universal stress protein, UspA family n=1 Tax=Geodermatophilus telluris TaxID=1190417 RepID=A0A1G6QIM4_9ACTN|nr:universal stress protein [Geodermatophilus telluris]SDC91764.1 Nucleotide-binding universal stress protein, UspA family [Geodermatophilus telluris]